MGPPPSQAEAIRLHNQALSLIKLRKGAQAIPLLKRAASMPMDAVTRAQVLRTFGVALQQVGAWEDSLTPLRQAEHVLKTDPAVPQALAKAFRWLGRHEEGVRACRRCLALAPGQVQVILTEIELLVRLKRDEEAHERIASAERAGIGDAIMDIAVAKMALRGGGLEDAAARLRRRIESGTRSPVERADLLFVLGEVLDADGRYDEAWAAVEEGNLSLAQRFDAELYATHIERAIEGWSRERIMALREGGLADERPVLVIGMPRSGTTLTERVLAAHPGVHAAGEVLTLTEAAMVISRVTKGSVDQNPERITPELITAAAEHYSGVLDRTSPGAARITNKLPMNVGMIGLFSAMFPRGRIVHCRRDPRDVCLSCFFRNFGAPTPYSTRPEWLAAFYRGYARLINHWRETFEGMPDAPSVHEVRYESFVEDPGAGTRALIAGVGLPWDEACLSPTSDARVNLTQRAHQAGQGVYSSSVGRHELYAAHLGEWSDLAAPSFSDG